MFWPGRKLEELTEDERKYTEHEQLEEGLLLWCPFNSLLNSSTRTELAAAIVAMIPGRPMNIGIDNAAVVNKGNQIIKYFDDKARMKLRNDEGKKILGGRTSKLFRKTRFERPWNIMKDGDSCEMFAQAVDERGQGIRKLRR